MLVGSITIVWGQTVSQFEQVGEISDRSLDSLLGHAIVISFDLSPDGRLLTILAIEGPKPGSLWVVNLDTNTRQIVASRKLGPSVWPDSDFFQQVRYSNDQRYLVVQDLQEIRVLDARTLETLSTAPVPAKRGRQAPLFIAGASKTDVFLCAFGSGERPKYGLQPTPVQVELVDVSSGKLLGTWESKDVPQAISPNGDLVLVSSWGVPNQRLVVPLAVFDKNGAKVADLDDGFSFSKSEKKSKLLGRVLGRFLDEEDIVVVPDQHLDDKGHHSGDSIKILGLSGHSSQKIFRPARFSPTGRLQISDDGNSILVNSFYIPPAVLANPHGPRNGGDGELFVISPNPNLHLASTIPIDSLTQDVRVSSDGSVIAMRHYNRDITILKKNRQ
jgi:hypothetical protein